MSKLSSFGWRLWMKVCNQVERGGNFLLLEESFFLWLMNEMWKISGSNLSQSRRIVNKLREIHGKKDKRCHKTKRHRKKSMKHGEKKVKTFLSEFVSFYVFFLICHQTKASHKDRSEETKHPKNWGKIFLRLTEENCELFLYATTNKKTFSNVIKFFLSFLLFIFICH